ncbi:MAG: phosphoribosylformylglycinamidine synthase subunit PurL [Bdellovibrionaceae bacterium]|nr:phosphoribosylformylglycinamidine synthase subunit PurL [Pseudobdellovibrionaceae bacterium]
MAAERTLTEKLKHYRISQGEYERISGLLGRPPHGLEWALFSALWSEHCSYKSSKVHLRKFSYRNGMTRDDSDENAGVVDIGFGEKIVFKMESHNHPSFIEPYQGAATGVGGILRDIFTMGARPIALADYLCFGNENAPRMKTLVKGVVSGISGYGNCVGVPTITGYTEYDENYNKNILVNAMAVGLLEGQMNLASSKAEGVGNLVVYVGAKTGKDGVHGAAMASESFDQDIDSKKPNIQIGDPFLEKLLIESCLEVLSKNLVVCMQDMGAAGLTSSTFEMASKGRVGMDLHLDKVPQRDSSITPEEILLSESQERMVLVCVPKNLDAIQAVFKKWDLDAAPIGTITDTKKMRLFWKGDLVTEIDPTLITDSAPRYERPFTSYQSKRKKDKIVSVSDQNKEQWLESLKQNAFYKNKNWIFEQYDQRVGTRTVRDASHTVSAVRLNSRRDLAISVGCRPAFMRMDTRIGAIDAIIYPALQQAVKGFKPIAVTDCLNFANPERVEVMTDFVQTCDLYAEIAQRLDAPIISGNVSFYNETEGKGITPTPAVGLVGLKENDDTISACVFNESDLTVFLVQMPGVVSYAKTAEVFKKESSFSGDLLVPLLCDFIPAMTAFAAKTRPQVSRVVGQGGLAVTLDKMKADGFECVFETGESHLFSSTEFLFEERLYDFVFAVNGAQRATFEKELDVLVKKWNLVSYVLGRSRKG